MQTEPIEETRFVVSPYVNAFRLPQADSRSKKRIVLGHGFFCRPGIVVGEDLAGRILQNPRRPFSCAELCRFVGVATEAGSAILTELWKRRRLIVPEGTDETGELREAVMTPLEPSDPLHPYMLAEHDLQLTSFGGTGTTMLYEFLESRGLNVPIANDSGQWKHMPAPPHDRFAKPGFRAVYLVGDPMDAVLSVFRRNYQMYHVRRMLGDMGSWSDTITLEAYLDRGVDLFKAIDQFENWFNAPRDYPILFVKYRSLWKHLPELFAFAGLPSDRLKEFPQEKQRHSSWQDEPPDVRKKLLGVYGELAGRIEELPDIFIRRSTSKPPPAPEPEPLLSLEKNH